MILILKPDYFQLWFLFNDDIHTYQNKDQGFRCGSCLKGESRENTTIHHSSQLLCGHHPLHVLPKDGRKYCGNKSLSIYPYRLISMNVCK